MRNYVYETHAMGDPLLPFIFHKDFVITQRNGLPNWHENIELLYCVEGKGFIQCGPDRIPFEKKDVFVVNADTPHCVCSEGSVIYQCLIVDNAFCIGNGIPIRSMYFHNRIHDDGLNGIFDEVVSAFENYDPEETCAAALIRCAVLKLLCYLAKGYTIPRPDNMGTANSYVKKTMYIIRQSLSETVTLDEIAEQVGISKYHLCREFKAFTGKTIVQMTNLIRCTEAKRMLETGSSVSEAAEACGYESGSYFTRMFKKQIGKLPSACVAAGTGTRFVHKDYNEGC